MRIATEHMLPVLLLSDGYIANGSEPWKVPSADTIPEIPVTFRTDPDGFQPFVRDPDTLARPWARPGTPGLEHRIGGLEHTDGEGNVSYDPVNHQNMTNLRAEKVARIARTIPPAIPYGDDSGDLLVLGWGGTYGALYAATRAARKKGMKVSHLHLRHLNPFPANLEDVLRRFARVLVAELNMGQLNMIVRARFLTDTLSLNKMEGQPFTVSEVLAAIENGVQGIQQ